MFRHFKIKTRLLWLGLTAITALALLGFLAISSINAILTQIHIDNKLVDINKGMYQARLGQADYIITGEARFLTINHDKTALALEAAQTLKTKMMVPNQSLDGRLGKKMVPIKIVHSLFSLVST